MIRLVIVVLGFAVGTVWGLQSVVGAGCLLAWNDFFRPAAWARYYKFLHWDTFPSHYYCSAILLFAVLFTRWKKRWTLTSTLMTIFLCWLWVCALFAVHWSHAYERTLQATKYLVPLIILSVALCRRRHQEYYLYTLAACVGLWLAQAGLHALVRGGPVVDMGIPSAQMTERNDFLVAGTGCLPLMIYVAWFYEGRLQRLVRHGAKAAALLAICAFFASESRGAVIGLAGLTIWFALATGRLLRRLTVVVPLILVGLLLVPGFVWDRMATINVGTEQSEASAASRFEIALIALEVTGDHPLFGIGAANFPYVVIDYDTRAREPHSLWLKCSTEFGIPMLLFFISLIVYLLVRLRGAARSAREAGDRRTEGMATALGCAIVGFLATGTFTSQFLSEYLWAMIALAGAFIAAEDLRGTGEPDVEAASSLRARAGSLADPAPTRNA